MNHERDAALLRFPSRPAKLYGIGFNDEAPTCAGSMSSTIYVDADACPVKDEVFRVAQRFEFSVVLVANVWMRTPDKPLIELVVVGDGFDAADDHIAEHAGPVDIVVTDDIPLASRAVAKGARALNHKGKIFTAESIGDTLATRDLLTTLRSGGQITGGPAPFRPSDRSNFLQALDTLCREVQRGD